MNNFALRTLSGIAFLLIMLAGLLVNKFLFAGLVVLVLSLMLAEFYKMTMGDKYIFSRTLAILASIILFSLEFVTCAYEVNPKIVSIAMLPILIVMINSLYVKDKSDFGLFSNIYAGLFFISIPLALLNLIAFNDGVFNGSLILCFFVIIWSSDVGAFTIGSLFGQKNGKKLFPSVSPKKSWIGVWGGMAFAVIAAVLMNLLGVMEYPIWHCIALTVLMVIAGVYGDLFESQWKRHYDIKDSGTIMPGHGGMLDRFDSALFAIPVGAVYLSLFNLL